MRLFLFFFFSLFFVLTAGATEYIVSPAPNDEFGVSIAGEEVIVVKDFTIYWQFLLWLTLMNIISTIDALLYPTKLIFTILSFRITKSKNTINIIGQYKIYTYIKNTPGAYITEIVEKVGLGRGAVKRHIYTLKALNKIEAHKDGVKTRYFDTNLTYNEEEIKVLSSLQNITTQRIILEIQNGNCNTNIALAREIGVTRATISWYVGNLKEIGLIKETKKGRTIIYRINSSYNSLLSSIGEEINKEINERRQTIK